MNGQKTDLIILKVTEYLEDCKKDIDSYNMRLKKQYGDLLNPFERVEESPNLLKNRIYLEHCIEYAETCLRSLTTGDIKVIARLELEYADLHDNLKKSTKTDFETLEFETRLYALSDIFKLLKSN